jgi:hypothetical protein
LCRTGEGFSQEVGNERWGRFGWMKRNEEKIFKVKRESINESVICGGKSQAHRASPDRAKYSHRCLL